MAYLMSSLHLKTTKWWMDHLEGIAFLHMYPAYVKAHLNFDEGSFPDKKENNRLEMKTTFSHGVISGRISGFSAMQ